MSDTTIGAQVKITGTLSSDGDVQFDGILESGEMQIQGCLTVGTTARVVAKVKAEQLIVHGTIEGNVVTKGDVEIGVSGKVQGDISAGGNLVIQPGGVFIGKSMMKDVRENESNEAEQKAQLKVSMKEAAEVVSESD